MSGPRQSSDHHPSELNGPLYQAGQALKEKASMKTFLKLVPVRVAGPVVQMNFLFI
jgi:hypothetical protein